MNFIRAYLFGRSFSLVDMIVMMEVFGHFSIWTAVGLWLVWCIVSPRIAAFFLTTDIPTDPVATNDQEPKN